MANGDNERSIGSLIKELTQDISTLFRSEVALAKLEIREAIAGMGASGALLGAALFLALFGIAFLFVTILLGLVALGVPAWVSSLVVTVVLFIAAAFLALAGKKKIQKVQFIPAGAIENMKTDIDTIKSSIGRAKGEVNE